MPRLRGFGLKLPHGRRLQFLSLRGRIRFRLPNTTVHVVVLRSKSSSVITVAMSQSKNFFRIVKGTVELVTILISSSSLALLQSASRL
jgi:hypothetical protein